MTTKISGGAAVAPIVEITEEDYARLERSPGFGFKISLEDEQREGIRNALQRHIENSLPRGRQKRDRRQFTGFLRL